MSITVGLCPVVDFDEILRDSAHLPLDFNLLKKLHM